MYVEEGSKYLKIFPLKNSCLLLTLLFLLSGTILFSQRAETKNKLLCNINKPFSHQVFIENKGQFDSILPDNKKTEYAYVNGDEQVYFTHTGLTYVLQKHKKLTEREWEEIEHDKKINLKSHKKCFIDVTWENKQTDHTNGHAN